MFVYVQRARAVEPKQMRVRRRPPEPAKENQSGNFLSVFFQRRGMKVPQDGLRSIAAFPAQKQRLGITNVHQQRTCQPRPLRDSYCVTTDSYVCRLPSAAAAQREQWPANARAMRVPAPLRRKAGGGNLRRHDIRKPCSPMLTTAAAVSSHDSQSPGCKLSDIYLIL